MADLIASDKDFVSYKQTAWHRKGTVVQELLTLEKAMELAGINFEVAIRPNEHVIYDDKGDVISRMISDDSNFTYRTDTNQIFGKRLGSKYTPLQNIDTMDWVGDLVRQGELQFETAGCIDSGRIIFATLKYEKPIIAGPNDEVMQYLLVTNSHDGSMSVTAAHTGVRVVCMNTLQMALSGAVKKHTIRHTSAVKQRLEEAVRILNEARYNNEVVSKGYQKLNSIRAKSTVTNPLLGFHDYLGKLFLSDVERQAISKGLPVDEVLSAKKRKLIKGVVDFTFNGVGQKEAKEMSPWWMYNGVTGFYSNVKKYKTEDKRTESMLWGTDNDVMEKALVLATKIKPGIHIDPRFKLNLN